MTWVGMEPVVDDVIATLRACLAGEVAAVNDEHADGIVITAPHDGSYLIGITDDELMASVLQLANPTVVVQGGDRLRGGDRTSPDLGGEYELENQITVSVLFQAMTLEERIRMTWRYQTAIGRVLFAESCPVVCRFEAAGYMERTIPAGVWREAVTVLSAITFETP